MSHTEETDATRDRDRRRIDADGQYGSLSYDDGSVVIYERRNPHAWIQSDATVELDANE